MVIFLEPAEFVKVMDARFEAVPRGKNEGLFEAVRVTS
jgi:hypothetical protein